MKLSFSRFLNLVYYRIVSNLDEKDRRKFDRALEREVNPVDNTPAWWKGDEDAAASGMAVARSLGLSVKTG